MVIISTLEGVDIGCTANFAEHCYYKIKIKGHWATNGVMPGGFFALRVPTRFRRCYHKIKITLVGFPWQARRAVKWFQQAAALGVAGLWWNRLEGPTRLTRSVNRLGRGPK